MIEYAAKAVFPTAAVALVDAAMRYIRSWLAEGQRTDTDDGNKPRQPAVIAEDASE